MNGNGQTARARLGVGGKKARWREAASRLQKREAFAPSRVCLGLCGREFLFHFCFLCSRPRERRDVPFTVRCLTLGFAQTERLGAGTLEFAGGWGGVGIGGPWWARGHVPARGSHAGTQSRWRLCTRPWSSQVNRFCISTGGRDRGRKPLGRGRTRRILVHRADGEPRNWRGRGRGRSPALQLRARSRCPRKDGLLGGQVGCPWLADVRQEGGWGAGLLVRGREDGGGCGPRTGSWGSAPGKGRGSASKLPAGRGGAGLGSSGPRPLSYLPFPSPRSQSGEAAWRGRAVGPGNLESRVPGAAGCGLHLGPERSVHAKLTVELR